MVIKHLQVLGMIKRWKFYLRIKSINFQVLSRTKSWTNSSLFTRKPQMTWEGVTFCFLNSSKLSISRNWCSWPSHTGRDMHRWQKKKGPFGMPLRARSFLVGAKKWVTPAKTEVWHVFSSWQVQQVACKILASRNNKTSGPNLCSFLSNLGSQRRQIKVSSIKTLHLVCFFWRSPNLAGL